jgi:hypothetical protein
MFNPFNKKASAAIGIILCLFSSAFAYSGGSGTEGDPYRIAIVSDWQQLMNTSSHWGKYFIMTADVSLQGVTLTPVGKFTGVFNGNGHIISNAVINQPSSDSVGLFGYINYGGQINNLGVVNVNITGRDFVGGLVGYNYRGTITNCYSAGVVSGRFWVGGLVGICQHSIIAACCATGTVSGDVSVGGLLGSSSNGSTITNCYATGAVSVKYNTVGGLVGDNGPGNIITNCYSTGVVTGSYAGGLVGNNLGTIISSFWDIETSGQASNRGGKGLSTSQMKSVVYYQNAGWANKGWVINDGIDYPHLAWENSGGEPIPESQPVPLLGSGTEQDPYQVWTADDFVLLSWYATVLDKHIALMADLDLSGIMLYIVGDLGPFTGVFEGNGHIIRNAVINQPENNYVGLFGCLDCGQICNLGVVDVNITGSGWVGGLVGCNDKGTITNCYATGAVSGGNRVGGLVGENGGIITACYATGAVSDGHNFVGGLAGSNCNYGTITNCYATGVVTGRYTVGGLVGWNVGSTITNCYATGAVNGHGAIGGLAGWNEEGTITNCYATGVVTRSSYGGGLVGGNRKGTVAGCFWDIETSEQTSSAGGTGKTTAQMKTRSTFTSAGWDFVGETANGTEDIWTICEGVNYPKFVWQNQPPIAEAGEDQTAYAWIDGIAEVDLDGSGSSDPDCNELTYYWSWVIDGNTYEANGVNPTIELPVGVHTIQLIVNDGLADSVPDDVNITVVSPLKSRLGITPRIINRCSRQSYILALVRMPDGIMKKDISNEPLVLYPGEIEASRQWVVSIPYGFGRNKKWLTEIFAFFDKDAVVDAIPINGKVKLKVAGELTCGRYFYGSDTVIIIGPRRPWHFPKK